MDPLTWTPSESGKTVVLSVVSANLDRMAWNVMYMPYLGKYMNRADHIFYVEQTYGDIADHLLYYGVAAENIKRIDSELDTPNDAVVYPPADVLERSCCFTRRPHIHQYLEKLRIRSFDDLGAFINSHEYRKMCVEDREKVLTEYKSRCYPLPDWSGFAPIKWAPLAAE